MREYNWIARNINWGSERMRSKTKRPKNNNKKEKEDKRKHKRKIGEGEWRRNMGTRNKRIKHKVKEKENGR